MAIRVVKRRLRELTGMSQRSWKYVFNWILKVNNEPLKRCHSKKFSSPSSIVNCTRDIFRDTLISLTNHDSIGNWVAFANSGQGFLDNIQATKQKLKSREKAPSKRYKKEFGGLVYCLQFYIPWNFKVSYFRGSEVSKDCFAGFDALRFAVFVSCNIFTIVITILYLHRPH